MATPPTPKPLGPGTEVEIRLRSDGRWARGFEIVDSSDGEYQLQRRVDGVVLPGRFRDHDPADTDRLAPGTPVEVHVRYDGRWSPGFEIADASDGSYRLLRQSDGALLPVAFPARDLRLRH